MRENQKKKISLRGKILTIVLGIIGIGYWVVGKAENAIESLYEN